MAGERPLLEWWPDYGGELLWLHAGQGGARVSLDAVGVSPELSTEITRWVTEYSDERLPLEGAGDVAWLSTGRELLFRVRAELAGRYEVIVTEPYWGEEPTT